MKNMNEKLRKNIQVAIKASGLKWGEVAQKLNITYPYLWRVIKGDRRLKPEMVEQIAILTGKTPNELYGINNINNIE